MAMTLQDTIREATSMAEHYEGEAQRLSQQYSGVRPGW